MSDFCPTCGTPREVIDNLTIDYQWSLKPGTPAYDRTFGHLYEKQQPTLPHQDHRNGSNTAYLHQEWLDATLKVLRGRSLWQRLRGWMGWKD